MKKLFYLLAAVLLFAVAARASAAPVVRVDNCSWNAPGANPFTGDRTLAVYHYADIPLEVANRLEARMYLKKYDDFVDIRRDRITGAHKYQPDIREMHFGAGKVCDTVDRSAWSDTHVERGMVYCDSGHCVLVPTVCGNVSRIARVETPYTAPQAPAAPGGGGGGLALLSGPPAPVQWAPPPVEPPAPAQPPAADPPRFAFPPSYVPPPPRLYPPSITPPVPEPATWLSMGLGLLAMGVFMHYRKRRKGWPRS